MFGSFVRIVVMLYNKVNNSTWYAYDDISFFGLYDDMNWAHDEDISRGKHLCGTTRGNNSLVKGRNVYISKGSLRYNFLIFFGHKGTNS